MASSTRAGEVRPPQFSLGPLALAVGLACACGSEGKRSDPGDDPLAKHEAVPVEPEPLVTAASRCNSGPAIDRPLTGLDPGREVLCALDIGSSNAKLMVASWERGKPDTLRDERQCRNRLGLGKKTFFDDVAHPLEAADIANLVQVIQQFQAVCAGDQGRMVGAEATQWARDATNRDEIVHAIAQATSLDLEVLTPIQEGEYGYLAATYGHPGRMSIDAGSNSFQLSWQPAGPDAPVRTVSIPFGYVRAARAYYSETTTQTYDAARTQHAAELRRRLDAALGELTPPTSLRELKALVASDELSARLFVLGQDGALNLAVTGKLESGGEWISTQSDFDALVRAVTPVTMPTLSPGRVAGLLTPAELATWFDAHASSPADFTTLRTPPVRPIYGEWILANTVLLDVLVRELGITQLVMVPQELPMGYIISKLAE